MYSRQQNFDDLFYDEEELSEITQNLYVNLRMSMTQILQILTLPVMLMKNSN